MSLRSAEGHTFQNSRIMPVVGFGGVSYSSFCVCGFEAKGMTKEEVEIIQVSHLETIAQLLEKQNG